VRYLKESANAFLQGRESRAPVRGDFYVNSELPEVCYDYSVSCVFSYDNIVDPKIDEIRLRFKNDPFRFFIGTDGLPFHGISYGDIIIYNAKKQSIIIVKDAGDLEITLDRVKDGGAKWMSLPKFEYSSEL
jgi:hypothetical protein